MALSRTVLFTFFVVVAKASTFSGDLFDERAPNKRGANQHHVLLAELFVKFKASTIRLVGSRRQVLSMKNGTKCHKRVIIHRLQLRTVCFTLLLLCGDIETNPGPVVTCPICKSNVQEYQHAVLCDRCDYWHHIQCVEMSDEMYNKLAKMLSFNWYCASCSKSTCNMQLRCRKRLKLQSDNECSPYSKKCNN